MIEAEPGTAVEPTPDGPAPDSGEREGAPWFYPVPTNRVAGSLSRAERLAIWCRIRCRLWSPRLLFRLGWTHHFRQRLILLRLRARLVLLRLRQRRRPRP